MQHICDKISSWIHDNGLVVNVEKTKVMHVVPPHLVIPTTHIEIWYTKNICSTGNINAGNITSKLEVVTTIKYLGVTVDSNLKWKIHIENVQKKLRQVGYTFYHLKNTCQRSVLKQVYHALAEPYIRHGITAWGASEQRKHLQKSQDKLLKLLTAKNGGGEIRILNVENIFKSTVLNTYYNEMTYRQKIDHSHDTRRKMEGKYKVGKCTNNYGKYAFESLIPTIFNELPCELLEIKDPYKRKKKIKTHLLDKQNRDNG